MTESERNHLLRMVKHAQKVRRQTAEIRRQLMILTQEELAEAIMKAKRKHPEDFP